MIMRTKNRELDVINLNITEKLNSWTTAIQPNTKLKQLTDECKLTEHTIETIVNNSDMNIDDVVESCPICQEKAFGKVVQCGTCWEWYHYECISVDDNAVKNIRWRWLCLYGLYQRSHVLFKRKWYV